MKKLLAILAVLLILANLGLFYRNYTREQARLRAEEEKRLQEQAEKERQRKFLEEKRREFDALIAQMKQAFAKGDYRKVRELSVPAYALAKQYGFPTTEIDELLARIDAIIYGAKLARLERTSSDIYTYYYVRNELKKFPALPALFVRIRKLCDKTYQNEYLVCLELAEKGVQAGMRGDEFRANYLLSTLYLGRALAVRRSWPAVRPDIERENRISVSQSRFFFSNRQLQQNSLPEKLYGQ